MNRKAYSTWFACLLFFVPALACSTEENFILLNAHTGDVIEERGPRVDVRVTPCSTFKVPLSLMGFDSGILVNKENPVWEFEEGYDDFLETWKAPQTPLSWMKYSCVWFSRVLAGKLGEERFQGYLDLFDYGNRDMSGGLQTAWINSSIAISPREQATFLQRVLLGKIALSPDAVSHTREILYLGTLQDGSKLYGKTGWTGSNVKDESGNKYEIGWFVGWIEKESNLFTFAYYIRDDKIELGKRVPRVKELLYTAVEE